MSSPSQNCSLGENRLHWTEEGLYDEASPLLRNQGAAQNPLNENRNIQAQRPMKTTEDPSNEGPIFGIISVLLIGVFLSQADTSLILATYGSIASEFDDLQNASWLLSSYMLSMCVAQPLYGKLSDIFGRKTMLQVSYILFGSGSALCGLCQSMPQLIVARSIQGLGGAGMVCLVSIIITDLVPLQDVASYRSYVNVIQTIGRSSGGVFGGFLTQHIGWRWVLSGQAPLTLVAIYLVAWRLQIQKPADTTSTIPHRNLVSKLKRVDFLGILLLSTTILCFLLVLDTGGNTVAWQSPIILMLCITGIFGMVLFAITETRWAKEPVFPLHLFSHYDVVTSYLTLFLQNASQTAMMFLIPLYVQVTKNATPSQAGAYMIPSIVGNAAGGLLAGHLMKTWGRTKITLIAASVSSILCFTLLFLFWRGDTAVWQTVFIFPGGFGNAVAHSVAFVALAAGVDTDELAIASSGLYLSGSIGGVSGLCAISAVNQAYLRSSLHKSLDRSGIDSGSEIIRRTISDIRYIQKLSGNIHALVLNAYVSSFRASFAFCILVGLLCFATTLLSREKRLPLKT